MQISCGKRVKGAVSSKRTESVRTYCIQSEDEFWANLFTGKSKSGSKYSLKFSLLETSCAHVLGSGTTTTTTLLYKTKERAVISMCKLQNIRISSLE